MLSALLALGIGAFAAFASPDQAETPKSESIVLGAGCFWCYEPIFEQLKGVSAVEVGYAGGALPNPTYQQVCTGATGHAEVYKVTYDPEVITAEDLLHVFFTVHDPTQLNRQGMDVGTQYRSAIFYANEAEKARAEKVLREMSSAKIYDRKIVTTIEPLRNYSRAEEYHQDYWEKYEKATPAERLHMNVGYCNAVVTPKVLKYRQKFAHLMKG
ncbi:peptide-methionine (S)-S-oxide reductase [bacterium]|nr:MAG: peptide-methionine (S)-S-oxide reductase [bacterium]